MLSLAWEFNTDEEKENTGASERPDRGKKKKKASWFSEVIFIKMKISVILDVVQSETYLGLQFMGNG